MESAVSDRFLALDGFYSHLAGIHNMLRLEPPWREAVLVVWGVVEVTVMIPEVRTKYLNGRNAALKYHFSVSIVASILACQGARQNLRHFQ